jgi:multisubunit Na+/H+ antiporter MnhG subunit
LSIVSYPFVYIGALIAIAAVILGIVGMVKISKNPDLYSNRWMAITAIILGGILLLLYALVIYILLMTLA